MSESVFFSFFKMMNVIGVFVLSGRALQSPRAATLKVPLMELLNKLLNDFQA